MEPIFYLHLASAIFFTGLLISLTYILCMTIARSSDAIIVALMYEYNGPHTDISQVGFILDDAIEVETDAVTCGGCGASVPTYDGFNPIEHDCDPMAK